MMSNFLHCCLSVFYNITQSRYVFHCYLSAHFSLQYWQYLVMIMMIKTYNNYNNSNNINININTMCMYTGCTWTLTTPCCVHVPVNTKCHQQLISDSNLVVAFMGVDHCGRGTGIQNLEWRDTNVKAPSKSLCLLCAFVHMIL